MKTKIKIFIVSTVIAFAALCLGIFFFGGWFDGQKNIPKWKDFPNRNCKRFGKLIMKRIITLPRISTKFRLQNFQADMTASLLSNYMIPIWEAQTYSTLILP